MSGTAFVLYELLRELSVKVSKPLCISLSDNPACHTIRSLHDSLAILHVSSRVFFIDEKNLACLSFPSIAIINKNEFCLLKSKSEAGMRVLFESGKTADVPNFLFQELWTGVVLVPEKEIQPYSDPFRTVKDICYYLRKYFWVVSIFILELLFIFISSGDLFQMGLGVLSSVGIVLSIGAILQKNNMDFKSVCRIGKHIDCEKVQRSLSIFVRKIDIGVISLAYFIQSFLLVNFFGAYPECYLMGGIGVIAALISVCWQAVIPRSFCLFCMLIDINLVVQYLWMSNHGVYIGGKITFLILAISISVGMFTAMNIAAVLSKFSKIKIRLAQRDLVVSDSRAFSNSLRASMYIREIGQEFSVSNRLDSNDRIQVLVSLQCKYCAECIQVLEKIRTNVSIVFKISPKDPVANRQILYILDDYLSNGIQSTFSILKKWYNKKELSIPKDFSPSSEASEMYRKHEEYSKNTLIGFLPLITVNNHVLPKYYMMEDLVYLL